MPGINENEQVGDVINKLKWIEYSLDRIIENHVGPKDTCFFHGIILNSSVISFGVKLKIIKTICEMKNVKYDFNNLHKLSTLRNIFAHESSYWDLTEQKIENMYKIDELRSDGKRVSHILQQKYDEFLEIYETESENIKELNKKLGK